MIETQMKEIRKLEDKYRTAVQRGYTNTAILRSQQIYNVLWEIYQSLDDEDEKTQITFEMDRAAYRERLLYSGKLWGEDSYNIGVTLFDADKELFPGEGEKENDAQLNNQEDKSKWNMYIRHYFCTN